MKPSKANPMVAIATCVRKLPSTTTVSTKGRRPIRHPSSEELVHKSLL
jgi:hypothetical protein